MICFEIWVNGKRVGAAGVEKDGVLTTTLYGMIRDGMADTIRVSVGGVDHPSGKRLSWLNRNLGLGDSVMIKVVELQARDEPAVQAGPIERAVN